MRLDHKKLKALSGSILELYRPVPTARLARHFISVLEQALPAEYLTYNDFRPETRKVEMTWNVEVPDYHEKLQPVFEKYMTENPLIRKFFEIGAAIPAMKITDAVSQKSFKQTNLYNEFYRPLGVDFQLACAISTQNSPFLALAFNRKNRDFTRDEVFILSILREHIRQALEISHALESATRSVFSMMTMMQKDGSGVILFDDAFRVLFISTIAEEIAASLFNCRPMVGQVLSAELKACVLKLRGDPNAEIPAPRAPLILKERNGSTVRLKLALDPERSSHCLIVERERGFTHPAQLNALGLSPRETDVAYWIIQNKTNWEIGRILEISPRTVDKHVEKIFAKLGVNNRAHLIARARELCE